MINVCLTHVGHYHMVINHHPHSHVVTHDRPQFALSLGISPIPISPMLSPFFPFLSISPGDAFGCSADSSWLCG